MQGHSHVQEHCALLVGLQDSFVQFVAEVQWHFVAARAAASRGQMLPACSLEHISAAGLQVAMLSAGILQEQNHASLIHVYSIPAQASAFAFAGDLYSGQHGSGFVEGAPCCC